MKVRFKHPSDRKLVAILLSVIALQTVVMWGIGQKVDSLWHDIMGVGTPQQQFNSGLGSFPIKVYTQSAIKGLYTDYGIVEPKENRVYFPELKFYLPLSQQARDLRYHYEAADNSDPKNAQPEQAQFTSAAILDRLMGTFDDVGCMQHVVSVSIGSLLQTDEAAVTKIDIGHVGAGRVMYIYRNSNPACESFWGSKLSTQISTTLKQAKPY
jgi:hypothetical protein